MDPVFDELISPYDFLVPTNDEDTVSQTQGNYAMVSEKSLAYHLRMPCQENVSSVTTTRENTLRDLYRLMQQPLQQSDNVHLHYSNRYDYTLVDVFYEKFISKRSNWRITIEKDTQRQSIYPKTRFHSANGLHNYLVRLQCITPKDIPTLCFITNDNWNKGDENSVTFFTNYIRFLT